MKTIKLPKSERGKGAVILDLNPQRAAEHNHLAHLHLAMGTAHAVLCGIELERIQNALSEADTRVSFDNWLEKNSKELGFSARMAYRYTAIAGHVTTTKLRKRDQALVALLMSSPHKLCDLDKKQIFDCIHKAVEGQSIRELLEELKIARSQTTPDNDGSGGNNGGGHHAVRPEQLVFTDILEPLGKFTKGLNRMVKMGSGKVHLWSTMQPEQLRVTDKQLEVAERELAEIRQQIAEVLAK